MKFYCWRCGIDFTPEEKYFTTCYECKDEVPWGDKKVTDIFTGLSKLYNGMMNCSDQVCHALSDSAGGAYVTEELLRHMKLEEAKKLIGKMQQ